MFVNSKLVTRLSGLLLSACNGSRSSRSICASSKLNFKFKLTEEMTKEFEEKQKAEQKPEPEKALHTLESSLIMGRVSSERFQKVIKVGVPKHRLNPQILLYIRENDDVQAYDEKDECKPGDWVLLRRQTQPLDEKVQHKVEKVVHSYGKYIDPTTGRRSLGMYYDDDFERLERIKIGF